MISDKVRRVKVKRRILNAVCRHERSYLRAPRKVDICQYGRNRADGQYWQKCCDELIAEGALLTDKDSEGSILLRSRGNTTI